MNVNKDIKRRHFESSLLCKIKDRYVVDFVHPIPKESLAALTGEDTVVESSGPVPANSATRKPASVTTLISNVVFAQLEGARLHDQNKGEKIRIT